MDSTNAAPGAARIDAMLALLRESAVGDLAPLSGVPAVMQSATQALETQNPIDEYIHRSTQPSQSQQYLTFVAEASALPETATRAFEAIRAPDEPHRRDLNDDLALTQLLVNNGALFNGAVGGMQPRGEAGAQGPVSGLSAKEERERKLARIRGLLKSPKPEGFDRTAPGESDAENAEMLEEFDAYLEGYDEDGEGEEDDDDADEGDDAETEETAAPPSAYGRYGAEPDAARRWMT